MKTALVTGGSRGIGAEIARALGRHGFYVVVNYFSSPTEAEKVVADIRAEGGLAKALQANVGSWPEIQTLFDKIEKEIGPVDVLVNNAGIEIRVPSVDYSEETWDLMMNTNLKGAFFCAQRALRTMLKRQWGRIVNISSIHEERPTANRSIYSISKGGMRAMTRELAKEYAAYGITVNSIAPGAIRTDLNRKVLEDPVYEANVLKNIPAKFIAEPTDIASTVLFLATNEARYINGASIYIDGGLSLN